MLIELQVWATTIRSGANVSPRPADQVVAELAASGWVVEYDRDEWIVWSHPAFPGRELVGTGHRFEPVSLVKVPRWWPEECPDCHEVRDVEYIGKVPTRFVSFCACDAA